MTKVTKVTLISESLGQRRFDIDHAQAILDYEKGRNFNNWTLLPTGGFELQDGVIKRANRGTGKNTQKRAETSESDNA